MILRILAHIAGLLLEKLLSAYKASVVLTPLGQMLWPSHVTLISPKKLASAAWKLF